VNFDKLKHFIKGEQKPLSSLDMKKASLIRTHHPKYKNWDARNIMQDEIWHKTNTNGQLNT
jgi:hypothetical protein